MVEVIDYMPVGLKRGEAGFRQLIRRIEAIRGQVTIRVELSEPGYFYLIAFNADGKEQLLWPADEPWPVCDEPWPPS